VCAYVIGMVTAYVLNRRFIFEKSGRAAHSEVWRFTLVNVVALAQVWGVSVILERWALPTMGWTWRPEEIAHAVGVVSPVFTSYFGHRYFTFRAKA
jgi:putative flippase GtrA